MEENRAWYKKKRYIIPLVFVGLFFIAGLIGSNNQLPTSQPAGISSYNQTQSSETQNNVELPSLNNITVPVASPNPATILPAPTANDSEDLSNDNHYTNVDGNTVHSPAFSNSGSIPAGASARCRDGTYSFSQNRRGTCSHHGGVAEWY
jgi:hypothetical protein